MAAKERFRSVSAGQDESEVMPRSLARATANSTRTVFPIPGSPSRISAAGPLDAVSSQRSIASSSASRAIRRPPVSAPVPTTRGF
jgi:hypothetical protein